MFTLPQNGERIRQAVDAAGGDAGSPGIADAVAEAAATVPPGGVVLLSPAAASFGVYTTTWPGPRRSRRWWPPSVAGEHPLDARPDPGHHFVGDGPDGP